MNEEIMAINKVMKAALKALSYREIDVKENLQLHRKFVNLTRRHILKPLFKTWNFKIGGKDYNIPVRVFSPHKEEGDYPVLLFFHGGGWSTGNIDTYNKVCTNMARLTNHKVVSVDYRLAPENPFPAGLEDCYQVARAFITNNQLNNRELTLIGDSAGANLAAGLSLLARDRKEFKINKQILIYPSTFNNYMETPFKSVYENGKDYLLTAKRMADYMEMYISKDEEKNSPYFAQLLAEDLSKQPKTLIITAEYCILRDEGEEYGKKLRSAGNYVEIYRIKDALHGFFVLPPRFPQVKLCYDIINRFLCEVN